MQSPSLLILAAGMGNLVTDIVRTQGVAAQLGVDRHEHDVAWLAGILN